MREENQQINPNHPPPIFHKSIFWGKTSPNFEIVFILGKVFNDIASWILVWLHVLSNYYYYLLFGCVSYSDLFILVAKFHH